MYVKSAEEVLTDALMRDLEENSDLDEVFDVDEEEEGAVEVEVDNFQYLDLWLQILITFLSRSKYFSESW